MKNLLIDGNNTIHRTYWTAKTQVGEDDPEKLDNFHIHFTLNAIKSYVAMYKPDNIYVAWDEKPDYQKNERAEMYEGYKQNRTKDVTPHRNNETIKKFLNALGIPSFYPRSLEADDCIAFLTHHLPGHKMIISVDKDFLQLVTTEVTLYDPIRKRETNTANFETNTGYKKEEFLPVKCILGDKSDNVPGIRGFGPAKVQKFLNGEISLSEEQQDIVTRNNELFRLDKYLVGDNNAEFQYYIEQYDKIQLENKPDYHTFLQLCEDMKMAKILDRKEDWHNLFFLKHTLGALFNT